MYQLTEKLSVEIKQSITPKTLKGLKELGLYSIELTADKEKEIISNLLIDSETGKKFIGLIFDVKEDFDYDEINLIEMMKGYQDFFGLLVGSFT